MFIPSWLFFKTVRVKWYSKYCQTRESCTGLLSPKTNCEIWEMSRNVKILGWEELQHELSQTLPGALPLLARISRDSLAVRQGTSYWWFMQNKATESFSLLLLVTAASPLMFWLTHAKYWAQFGLGKLWLRSDEATERRTKKGLAPQDSGRDSGRDSVWNSRLGTRFLPRVKSNQNNILILAQSLNMEHSDTSGRL